MTTPQAAQRRYRTAIIGTGAIATAHARAVGSLPERAEVVAAVDLDAARALAFTAEWGIPATYGTVDELLAGETLDLVHICTPPSSHVPLAIACLRAGVVPLIEKPPTLTLRELDELRAVELETGLTVATVFQHRFGSAAIRLRELIRDDALGRPLLAMCNTFWYRDADYFAVPWRGSWEIEGGGPTLGHGIHQFDLLLSILGEWEEITAIADRQSRPTDTEDVSAALVRFSSGAIATVVNSLVSPRETSQLRFDFERATVEVEHLYGYTSDNWRITPIAGEEALATSWAKQGDEPSGHRAQMAAVFDALDAGVAPPVGLSEARNSIEFVAAVYASAFSGRPVRRGDIVGGDPFYSAMQGTGAPWLASAQR